MSRARETATPDAGVTPFAAATQCAVLDRRDVLLLAALTGLTALYLVRTVSASGPPMEDAAMLLRYAGHVARGEGLVWNPGQHPVDGATDLVFTLLVAAGARAGSTLEAAAKAIGATAHVLTVVLVYYGVRRFGGGRLAAVASAAYLAVGPGRSYVAACFGTPLFALAAGVGWLLTWRLARRSSDRLAAAFALWGVLMGMIRPEGAILAVAFMAAVVFWQGWPASRRSVIVFCAVFGLAGGLYFAWHWSYFGYPLPNPFYRKGGGRLHWVTLLASVHHVAELAGPFVVAYLLGLRSSATLRALLFAAIPVSIFAAAWVLLSDEADFFMRFQYPLLPIILTAWPPLVAGLGREWRQAIRLKPIERRLAAAALALAALAVLFNQHRVYRLPFSNEGLADLALRLRPYADRHYSMATTEAGLLPFYSGWRAIDTWGLNDAWIAHHGAVTAEYLDRYHPEVVTFHAAYSTLTPPPTSGPWNTMVLTLQRYVLARDYVLAADFGRSPYDTQFYYVRRNFADSQAIVAAIRTTRYVTWGSPTPAIDFAALARRIR